MYKEGDEEEQKSFFYRGGSWRVERNPCAGAGQGLRREQKGCEIHEEEQDSPCGGTFFGGSSDLVVRPGGGLRPAGDYGEAPGGPGEFFRKMPRKDTL